MSAYQLVIVVLLAASAVQADVGNRGAWGDQGDGTYKNPILPGDFSDPDVIRVGSDFFLITSTFQYSPGMAVLKSRDMVNWRYAGHCIDDVSRLGPSMNWDQMNEYNKGVYAGSLRYHAGRFYLFTTTMHHGVFMTSAASVTGPWDSPTMISDRKGVDDNCPFWDDNGQAYMVFSTPGKQWKTRIVKMSSDGKTVDMASEKIIDDYQTSEGNKIYKIDGTYYIFHNEVRGSGNRVGVMMRSKNIYGPYDKKEILHGTTADHEREPNQGALVQSSDGSWWFFTHQGRGGFFDGRPTSLLPVKWIDGWPIPGKVDASGAGNMIWSYKKPIDGFLITAPQSSDTFNSATLSPQWEWNYQPRAEKWSLTERPGWLRLKAFKPIESANTSKPGDGAPDPFYKAGNTLTQRVMGYSGGTVVAKFDVSNMTDGQCGGLALFHGKCARLGAVQNGGGRSIEFNVDGKITAGPQLKQADLWVRAVIDDQPKPMVKFAYSLDGKNFTGIGSRFQLEWANYRGSRIALYSYNPTADAGQFDVDFLTYDYPGPGKQP